MWKNNSVSILFISTYSFVKSFTEKTTDSCFDTEYGLVGWCTQIQKAVIEPGVLINRNRQFTLFDLNT